SLFVTDRQRAISQALRPELERRRRNLERDGRDLTRAEVPLRHPRPRKEREDRARRADPVAEVEVVGPGIVEVDGQLDEAKADDLRVEVERPLRIARDRGDVMDA